MFFTGFTRFSSEIQKVNTENNISGKETMLKKMRELVDEAEHILVDKEKI